MSPSKLFVSAEKTASHQGQILGNGPGLPYDQCHAALFGVADMTRGKPTIIAASVQDRLRHLARE